jgi:hypothetical protein
MPTRWDDIESEMIEVVHNSMMLMKKLEALQDQKLRVVEAALSEAAKR